MRVKAELSVKCCRRTFLLVVRPLVLGIGAAALLVGCSTDKPSAHRSLDQTRGQPDAKRGEASPADIGSDSTWTEPGPIAITCPTQPASFSFDHAEGRVESAGDGAARAVRSVLTTPHLGHPQLEAAVGVLGFVAAPFAASYGAVSAAHQRMPADTLAEAEADLTHSMRAMAEQENLRQALLQGASDQTQPRFVPFETGPAPSACDQASAVVEARLEELRLERAGASDSTFSLLTKARAKLVRKSDGVVLSDRSYEYRSGQAMFIDWTRPGGLEDVARTAYLNLATQIRRELAAHLAEPAVRLGAGYKASPTRTVSLHRAGASSPAALFVRYQPTASPRVVYSAEASTRVSIQRPLTKAEAVAEARSDLEYQFDGLEQDRNSVVQALACLVATPIGLWQETAALVQGVSRSKVEAADARLSSAARQTHPEAALANEVARALVPPNGPPVMLARAGASEETALEIRVVRAALAGKPGPNSPLALCVEAQATLVRSRDHQELYSCPVQYRSREQKFADWAAHDARQFRHELTQCYSQMSGAIVERLVQTGWVPDPARTKDVIAKN